MAAKVLVADLVKAMGELAPLEYAESWDRVGLLVGRPSRELKGPVLLTIDLTERVLAEAEKLGVGAIIAYHPPIWDQLKRLTEATPAERIVLRIAELGIAVYSPHTALDAVPGGICDWLCEGLSGGQGRIAGDCRALIAHPHTDETQEVKIVTFVPAEKAEEVRNALATAGAGIVGGYKVCSFAVGGIGTFLGDATTHPTVGQAGKLESVQEVRIEMVCSKAALALAIETLDRFHPYETPALDVYDLAPKPMRHFGPGRRLNLDQPVPLGELGKRLKAWLGQSVVRIADTGSTELVRTIGVCPGSGNKLAIAARAEKCDAYVTGEMSHHDVLACLHANMSVVLGEHTGTERGYLPRLAANLATKLPNVRIVVSEVDRDPLVPA